MRARRIGDPEFDLSGFRSIILCVEIYNVLRKFYHQENGTGNACIFKAC